LEQGLYSQALKLGVKFHFNIRNAAEVDIIASGPRSCNGIIYGAVFKKKPDVRDSEMVIMFNDKISSKHSYMFAVPYEEYVEIFNVCTPRPAKQLKNDFLKGLSYFTYYFTGSPLWSVTGIGNFLNPKKATSNGQLFIGEAAGFQDPFMGFGNHFSIRSGFLVAKSIIENQNYDDLWKQEFSSAFNIGLFLRFFSNLWGDQFFYWLVKNLKQRYYGFISGNPLNYNLGATTVLKFIIRCFSRLQILKRNHLGRW
jgi:flavin-dependent dehydrogenase